MKKLVLIFGLVLIFIFLLGMYAFGDGKLDGYVWEEPNGYFKVTIPNNYKFEEEVPFFKDNPDVNVYKFVNKDGSRDFIIVWWEKKTVHNFRTVKQRVRWNIDFIVKQFKGEKPTIGSHVYGKGRYWLQKSGENTHTLFFIRKDHHGNFVGYEYWRPISMGNITNITDWLKYMSSFEF